MEIRQRMDKDLISLLYVNDEKNEAHTNLFSRANGFISHFCSDEKQVIQVAGAMRFDIILIDVSLPIDQTTVFALKEKIKRFDAIVAIGFKPAFFLGVDRYPEFETRMELYGYGFDEIIVHPLSAQKLCERSRVYLEKNNLAQQQIAQAKRLEKSFHYLDKFKRELKLVKKELIQEKNSLNNALKQIHHMTRERSQLKKSLLLMKECLGQNVKGFEKILSTLIKTRIEVNRGHADRVAHIACFIAKQLNFDEKKLEDLRKAAMLHEVGLLFMPPALEKERKEFTSYENNMWIQYPVKGADLLNECQGFEDCSEMIRFLNENSDGTGCPDGLKKRVIPLASRILAGADEFDRLKDRSEVNCLEDLLASLENISGSRLDPAIVGRLEQYAVLHMGSDEYRVRGVGVEQLEPGMRLGTALFTVSGTKLFSVDTLLNRESIEKIIQYHREYPVDETVYIKA